MLGPNDEKRMPNRSGEAININNMIKRDQTKPRRAKDRVRVSLLILFFRFHSYIEDTILYFPELQKSHGYAGITREEGLQNRQSVRKVSCQHTA